MFSAFKPIQQSILVGAILTVMVLTSFGQAAERIPYQASVSISDRIQQPFTGDLPQLRERRLIRVLVSYTRTNFFMTKRGFRGIEHDLLKAYENYLNRGPRKQRYQTHLTFIPMPFGDILLNLEAGYGDIAASGLTITPEREALVDFTNPYITNVREIVVSHLNSPKIEKLADFSGKQVIVVDSSSYIIHLERINQTLGQMGLTPMEIIKADPLMESEDLLELVNEDIYQYTVVDNHIAHIWKQVLENIRVQDDLVVHHDSNIAWAIQKHHPKLKASLNRFIQAYAKPGRLLGNSVYKKYFEDTYWVKKPLTHDLLKKITCLKYYFQRYAEFYDFDWKLIAALSYQESRFDPKKKSHMGAVGIMQIKPSTAADKNVNLPNIDDLETNIHAGVKYLAFLRDRYFSSDNYTPEERDNFTLAAYNAGPGRVMQLQRKAENLGLNRHKWFYNVESAARQIIGHETVNYVTSIQKMRLFLDVSKRLDQNKRLLLEKTVSKKHQLAVDKAKEEAAKETEQEFEKEAKTNSKASPSSAKKAPGLPYRAPVKEAQ